MPVQNARVALASSSAWPPSIPDAERAAAVAAHHAMLAEQEYGVNAAACCRKSKLS